MSPDSFVLARIRSYSTSPPSFLHIRSPARAPGSGTTGAPSAGAAPAAAGGGPGRARGRDALLLQNRAPAPLRLAPPPTAEGAREGGKEGRRGVSGRPGGRVGGEI